MVAKWCNFELFNESLAKETEDRHGYSHVRTPHLTKGDLYQKSDNSNYIKMQCIQQWMLMERIIMLSHELTLSS